MSEAGEQVEENSPVSPGLGRRGAFSSASGERSPLGTHYPRTYY